MKRINTLFYCSFFDNRKQHAVLSRDGLPLCRLLSSEDFASFLHLDISVAILAVFHDDKNTLFDDMDLSYERALAYARDNAQKLLATFSLS